MKTLIRNTGPTMSPLSAWVALKGLETLRLRDAAQAAALAVARHLEQHLLSPGCALPVPGVAPAARPRPRADDRRRHPRDLRRDRRGFAQDDAFAVLDRPRLFDISNNFGDAKSLVTQFATTTHHRIGPEARGLPSASPTPRSGSRSASRTSRTCSPTSTRRWARTPALGRADDPRQQAPTRQSGAAAGSV
ncbi:MAG: PLP-dependent transferase [Nocardioides sp.]